MVLHTRLNRRRLFHTGASILEAIPQPEEGFSQTTNNDEQWISDIRAHDDIDQSGWVPSRFPKQGYYAETKCFHR
jgi:hypothetical protein